MPNGTVVGDGPGTRWRSSTRRVLDWLPEGRSLPAASWEVRHRALNSLLWAHVAGIFAFGLSRGAPVGHSLAEAALVASLATVGRCARVGRRARSLLTALGLVTSSAVLVHLSDGTIEVHFHFFVVVAVMALYQDWVPFLGSVGFVVVHHAVVGTAMPTEVYNHPEAIAHPVRWAAIHGGFVLAASVVSVVAWRINEEQAVTDALTGLPNRRRFQDRLTRALDGHPAAPQVAVLFVDLDGFKEINDTLGHAAGDQVLAEVGVRLRRAIRSGDVAARFGGDEFAVLVHAGGRDQTGAAVADRILEALRPPIAVAGRSVSVRASVGVSVATAGATVEALLREADASMYVAKQGGGARCERSHPARQPVLQLEPTDALDDALDRIFAQA